MRWSRLMTVCRLPVPRAVVALAGLLLMSFQVDAQNLTLTLASTPPSSGIVSTGGARNVSLNVLSGHQVSFARSGGRDYRLEAAGGFYWTQVQELPRDSDAVALTPLVREDGSIEVAVEVSRKADSRQQSFRTTLLAQPGEWLQLFGPAPQSDRGTRVYGTPSQSGDSLYLLIEPR